MRKINVSITALIFAVIATGFIYVFIKQYTSFKLGGGSFDSINIPANDTSFGTLFASLNISDSIPHYRYKIAEDSLKRITDVRDWDNKGIGEGISTLSFGVIKTNIPGQAFDYDQMHDSIYLSINDSLQQLFNTDVQDTTVQKNIEKKASVLRKTLNKRSQEVMQQGAGNYYFELKNYSIDYPTSFFIKHGSYNLAFVKWDKIKKKPDGDSIRYGHFEQKQIPIRYGSDKKTIMIPIKKSTYQFLYVTIQVCIYLVYLLSIYFFIGLPIMILINISKGKPFSPKNISYLKTMAFVAFAYCFINIALYFSIPFFLQKLIPSNFQRLPFIYIVPENLQLLFFGTALFIIAKAFERGYNLQTEQDLTI